MKRGKLDARFKGYDNFKYFVGFRYNELNKFNEVRAWCWEQFGPHPRNPDAWSRWEHRYANKIHFRDEQDYMWFLLRWS